MQMSLNKYQRYTINSFVNTTFGFWSCVKTKNPVKQIKWNQVIKKIEKISVSEENFVSKYVLSEEWECFEKLCFWNLHKMNLR